MKVSMDPKDAKAWFGANPPDLTVIARSRADGAKGSGADYLYTYMRNFYRDDTKAYGAGTTWPSPASRCRTCCGRLQGQRAAKFEEVADPHDHAKKHPRLCRLRAADARQAD